MADDRSIREHIAALVEEERELRRRRGAGEIARDDEQARLADLEARLDEYWDLLRQREAKREFHEDPDAAEMRPERVVENYEG